MYKKTITYTDYNGENRTEDFYFNLSQAEIAEMSMSVNGGLENFLLNMMQKKDSSETIKWFKTFVLKVYGEKTLDGKYFRKSEEISNNFESCEAYSVLIMELLTPGNENKAAEFFNAIVPDVPPEMKAKAPAEIGEKLNQYNIELPQ